MYIADLDDKPKVVVVVEPGRGVVQQVFQGHSITWYKFIRFVIYISSIYISIYLPEIAVL